MNIDQAAIVVLPLCYENAASYGTGSKYAPFHILEASVQLENIDEETMTQWSLSGIHTLAPLFPSSDPEQAVMEMKESAANIFKQNKFLLSLGGDHAITLGPVMAAAEIYPDMSVLQIDAHLDLRDEWNNSRYNHACVMRRIADIGISFVQVGIRSFSKEEFDYICTRNFKPFFAHNIDSVDDQWMESVVKALPEHVYITIDLDGLDPSVIPGTGTPEPGGLSYRQLVKLIKTVGKQRKVIGADINELVKIQGTQVSEFTAAKIATKIFIYCRKNP